MDCVYTKYLDYLKMWSSRSDITPQLILRFIMSHQCTTVDVGNFLWGTALGLEQLVH